MRTEQDPLPIRLKRTLPWATFGVTRDMEVTEVVMKAVLDSVSWIGFLAVTVGPIGWGIPGSYAFFMGKYITYKFMRKHQGRLIHG